MSAPQSADSKAAAIEQRSRVDSIEYRQRFPWLRMFDLFWIALDLQKVALAAAALLLLGLGNWGFGHLPFARGQVFPTGREGVLWNSPVVESWIQPRHHRVGTEENGSAIFFDAGAIASRLIGNPIETVVRPARVLFRPDARWSQLAMAWTQLLWALMIFAVFGGAITRIAAVQIGSGRKLGMVRALRFSLAKFFSFFGAPLLPWAGIGLLWGLCLLVGLAGRIPGAGPWIVGFFWGLALLLGLLMALLLIGAAVGWPLMLATISVEGSDAFDGLSRSYGYVFIRPWYYAWLLGIGVVQGMLATFFITFVAWLSKSLAVWGVSWGMGTTDALKNPLATIWGHLVFLFVASFALSYFWSAATMIYFLLRRSIDANDFSEVYPEEKPPEELPLPDPAGDLAESH